MRLNQKRRLQKKGNEKEECLIFFSIQQFVRLKRFFNYPNYLLKANFQEAESSANSRRKNSYSDWLKMFGEMIPTFSSRNISPHFACKIKTNESAHAQQNSPANSPMISLRGNPP